MGTAALARNATGSPEWTPLLHEADVCGPVPPAALEKLFWAADVATLRDAASERQVSPDVLVRYIRVSRWPGVSAALAAGGQELANRYIAVFNRWCGLADEGTEGVALADDLFGALRLFAVLVSYNRTGVPDSYLLDVAEGITYWVGKASEEQEGVGKRGRVRLALQRTRTAVKRAVKRRDGGEALLAINRLPDREWRLLRAGARVSGAAVVRRLPVDLKAMEQALDLAIAEAGVDRYGRRVRGPLPEPRPRARRACRRR